MVEVVALKLVTGSPNTVRRMLPTDTLAPAVVGVTSGVPVGTTQIQTLTDKTLIEPKVDRLWNGTSEAPTLAILGVPGTQHNYIEIQNQISNGSPRIQVSGNSFGTNINLVLGTKGTGIVQVRYAGTTIDVVDVSTAQTLTNKTLTSPTIGNFTNAPHNHLSAAGGGLLTRASFQPGQGMAQAVVVSIADGAAVANTTAETSLGPTWAISSMNTEMGAVGTAVRITCTGFFSTTGTPTLTLRLRLTSGIGTFIFIDSGAVTMPSGVTNEMFSLEAVLVVRALGAGGLISGGMVQPFTFGAVTERDISVGTSFNYTTLGATATALIVSAQWGTASVSNTITCQQFIVERLN